MQKEHNSNAVEQAVQGMRVVFLAQYTLVLLAALSLMLTIAIRDLEASEPAYYDPVAYETTKDGCFVYPLDQPNANDRVSELTADGWVPSDSSESLYNPQCF